ncbi:hypothetical protein ACFWZU_15600 [Frateuria sp. GZRR33]|uniref:hypothetical protein n=1 Tax=Frateuria sp. GZRR33 TaxID=3351535 RepID=UPI003EDBD940
MRIHITTDNPTQAAWELYDKLAAVDGQWVVHSVGKEGFVAGRLGTRYGDALAKYSPDEGLCGVYRGGKPPSLNLLREDLRMGRREYLEVYGESADRGHEVIDRRGTGKDRTFTPLEEIAYAALEKTGPHSALSLAAELRSSRSATTTALKKLLEADRVKVVRLLPSTSPRGGVKTRVFGVAA